MPIESLGPLSIPPEDFPIEEVGTTKQVKNVSAVPLSQAGPVESREGEIESAGRRDDDRLQGDLARLRLTTASESNPKIAETDTRKETVTGKPDLGTLKSLEELTDEAQLKLQEMMEKKTQIESTPSNVLKSFENTQRDLTANLK